MKIIATNIGNPTTFQWNGKEEKTGIFKYPVDRPLFLGKFDVSNDTICNRINHGGIDKACYLFSKEEYPYWKVRYPELQWNWGMFGENLTVAGLDDAQMRIGDIYKIGTALVQVSQPREPCYKLGIRFGNQEIIQQYIERGHPGTYVRILEEGLVATGDEFKLVSQSKNTLTTKQFFDFLNASKKDPTILGLVMENESVPSYKKDRLKKYL
ncbi:MAG: MOSC domain-containing protein [Maribacter sp.]|nr:MOSC domain-containing protein [Maribacter sp.]